MLNVIKKIRARSENTPGNAPVLMGYLGDSVTHGCFEIFMNNHAGIDCIYDEEAVYPAQVRKWLNRMYPAAAVSTLNAGISGGSAPAGAARLERDILRFSPDIVVVNFGLNDAMAGEEHIDRYLHAMREIMERVLSSGSECVLLTPNRMCDYVSASLKDPLFIDIANSAVKIQNEGVLDLYVNEVRKIASSLGVPIADAYEDWNRMKEAGVDTTALLANAINHPTREMHQVFVKRIIDTLMQN